MAAPCGHLRAHTELACMLPAPRQLTLSALVGRHGSRSPGTRERKAAENGVQPCPSRLPTSLPPWQDQQGPSLRSPGSADEQSHLCRPSVSKTGSCPGVGQSGPRKAVGVCPTHQGDLPPHLPGGSSTKQAQATLGTGVGKKGPGHRLERQATTSPPAGTSEDTFSTWASFNLHSPLWQ